MRRLLLTTMMGSVTGLWPMTVSAQQRLDRADPTIAERALPQSPPAAGPRIETTPADAMAAPSRPMLAPGRIAAAIAVDGVDRLPPSAFAEATADYVARSLSLADLEALAGAVATVARKRDYPLATASIAPQPMTDGILRVTLDEGRIDAVRVIGAPNPLADALLTKALVTGHAVRGGELERAIELVDDIPGVRVKESSFTRQDGFGILLVTIVQDRASAYVQFDNRGTEEIGPIRTTMIANYRGAFQTGDEIGLIAAATPFDPDEFGFARLRYTAPVDRDGSTIGIGISYGRAQPGGALAAIDVVGNSFDLTAAYTRPLLRSRARSLWGSVEFRAVTIDQQAMGVRLRDDRLATLTGSLTGVTRLGSGILRGEVSTTAGLPLAGVTHQGDPGASRRDGDARFVIAGYSLEWTRGLDRRFSVALASSGQLASRPLLATAEIGVGGPGFARAYDNAERTGDQGVLGSLELRSDLGALKHGLVDRVQLYGFVDGGYVDNLRAGFGGGSLASSGGGVRVGSGRIDAMAEIAVPLGDPRFETGNRQPRISARIARSF